MKGSPASWATGQAIDNLALETDTLGRDGGWVMALDAQRQRAALGDFRVRQIP